jgi:hypothetical protein
MFAQSMVAGSMPNAASFAANTAARRSASVGALCFLLGALCFLLGALCFLLGALHFQLRAVRCFLN